MYFSPFVPSALKRFITALCNSPNGLKVIDLFSGLLLGLTCFVIRFCTLSLVSRNISHLAAVRYELPESGNLQKSDMFCDLPGQICIKCPFVAEQARPLCEVQEKWIKVKILFCFFFCKGSCPFLSAGHFSLFWLVILQKNFLNIVGAFDHQMLVLLGIFHML